MQHRREEVVHQSVRLSNLCFPSYLLSFNLFRAQRLRRSQPDIEGLAPQFAVAPFASGSGSRGNPWHGHGGAGVGDRCRDDARLYGGGRCRRRRRRGCLRLIHVTEADGALQTWILSP